MFECLPVLTYIKVCKHVSEDVEWKCVLAHVFANISKAQVYAGVFSCRCG